jgi:hypothetical protein
MQERWAQPTKVGINSEIIGKPTLHGKPLQADI